MEKKSHCHFCGNPLTRRKVEGRKRLFCSACMRPIYENPIPATCLVVIDERQQVLLVKRKVDPKKGQWCLPGGFLELGESPEAGALRELAEETGLNGTLESMLGVLSTPSTQYHSVLLIGYLVTEFLGHLVPGDDATEARWFPYHQIPPVAFESHSQFMSRYFVERGSL